MFTTKSPMPMDKYRKVYHPITPLAKFLRYSSGELNIITGETGTSKSTILLLDAMGLANFGMHCLVVENHSDHMYDMSRKIGYLYNYDMQKLNKYLHIVSGRDVFDFGSRFFGELFPDEIFKPYSIIFIDEVEFVSWAVNRTNELAHYDSMYRVFFHLHEKLMRQGKVGVVTMQMRQRFDSIHSGKLPNVQTIAFADKIVSVTKDGDVSVQKHRSNIDFPMHMPVFKFPVEEIWNRINHYHRSQMMPMMPEDNIAETEIQRGWLW